MMATSPLPVGLFDATHYADTARRRLRRSLELGPRYYLRDLPRYLAYRKALGLLGADWTAWLNPLRELLPAPRSHFPLPPAYSEALEQLAVAGVRVTLPPPRLEALAGAWWATRRVPGDAIECGSYRGATGLLLALLGRLHGLRQTVFLLDTFAGAPASGPLDVSRRSGEFTPPPDSLSRLAAQAAQLDLAGRLEIHQGLFGDTFARLSTRPLRFALVHIDANLHESTREACAFVAPRTAPGGLIVFDDYNGVCDLGARLAIDLHFRGRPVKPLPLCGSSAYVRIGAEGFSCPTPG